MNIRRQCPFCFDRTGSRGSKPWGKHVSISLELGVYKCWRCGAADVLTPKIAAVFGLDLSDVTLPEKFKKKIKGDIPSWAEKVTRKSVAAKRARKYLKSRGVKKQAASLHGVRVAAGSGTPRHMVGSFILPSCDPDHKGWVARLKGGGYFNAPGFSTKRALYGVSALNKQGPLFVVEGPFDRLCIWPIDGISTFGKEVSIEQIDRIVDLFSDRDLVIALDGDSWFECRALAMRLFVRGHSSVSWVKLSPGVDPGDMGPMIVDLPVMSIGKGEK